MRFALMARSFKRDGLALFFVSILGAIPMAGAGESKPSWQDDWGKSVEAAKREGQVVLSTVSGFTEFFREFEKRFPPIKVIEGASGQVAQRTQVLLAERRADKFLKDVSFGQQDQTQIRLFVEKGILDPLPPVFVLPEVVDPSKWWKGKHHYADAKGKYFFILEGAVRAADIAYNRQLVEPKEIRSYWDLVQPRWQGKIVVPDPRDARVRGISGSGLLLFYYHPNLGPPFIKRLFSEMKVTLSRDYDQMMDWLAVGKFAVYFFSRGTDDAVRKGLPVGELTPAQFKEGGVLTPIRGVIALLNRAPHPNAAKVFINWVLSREGQTAFQKVSVADNPASGNSMREDISKDIIPPGYRREPGLVQVEALSGEMIDTRPIIKLVDEILGGKP